MGYLFGLGSKHVINRIKLDYEGLYPVLSITLMFLTYSVTTGAGGSDSWLSMSGDLPW